MKKIKWSDCETEQGSARMAVSDKKQSVDLNSYDCFGIWGDLNI